MLTSLKITIALALIFFSLDCYSQTHQWSFDIGGSPNDYGHVVYADNNGYIYVVGYFAGTNIDFDPSPSNTAFLSSKNGSKDGFVAKYTTDGKYVWAFSFGGDNLDEANAVTVDKFGNVYVTGYFRGTGVDFDPSAGGTALLTSNGEAGGDPGYGGDIFIAKYNSLGKYQWAFNVGGTSLGDNGMVIACDNAGDVYTSGYFRQNPDFDPSMTAIHTLDASTGTMYVAKYTSNGQYQWAFNLGQGNVDNAPFGMRVDASGNILLTGFFQGVNQDFDPSLNGTSNLTSKGGFDIFAAKYNSSGQYIWAFSIGGSNVDVGRDIEVDNNGNVYIVGDFDGSNVDFDPSRSTANLTTNNRDVFIAKYDANGQYQWAKNFGGSGADISWSLAYTKNNIYITGSFQGTMNFNPGPTNDNLVSNGANDFYVTKFDVNGNYVCAFNVGGYGNDDAYKVACDNSGNLYVTGILSSDNTDFDPQADTRNLSTNGGSDIFIAKYSWPDNPKPDGTLSGSTICNGQPAKLTFTASSGIGPFTIQYRNGSNVFTQTNVQSGVPFTINPLPSVTTDYDLVSIKDATRCAATNMVSGITATVTISSGGSTDFTYSQSPCSPKTVQFFSSNQIASNYSWDFGNGTTISGLANPSITYNNFGLYTVKLITQGSGCTESTKKEIPIAINKANVILSSDTTICSGSSLQLKTNSGINFCWRPDPSIHNPDNADATVSPTATTTYYFTTQTENNNLVTNGDFSKGNTGFTSDYNSTSVNTKPAEYYVANDPNAWNVNFSHCGDHTTGIGKMMMVNGSSVAGSKIWEQAISISPNTNYSFSLWITTLAASNSASLKFSINGIVLANNITSDNATCQWKRIFTTWNSGSSSTAVIAIINSNNVNGNQFAVDDISFSPVFLKQDSINVKVDLPPAIKTRPDTTICEGGSIQLNTTGGQLYSWSPSTTLSNPNVPNPVAKPIVTTSYIVSAYNTPGCIGKDTVTINVLKSPDILVSKDTVICSGTQTQLTASGGIDYLWTPSKGLSAGNISSPVASPDINTTYSVRVTNANGCVKQDSVMVKVAKLPTVSTIADIAACKSFPVTLETSSSGAVEYFWYPTLGLNNPSIASPIASPTSTIDYIVTVKSPDNCVAKDTVHISVLSSPTVTMSHDSTICNQGKVQLVATGGIDYKWFPATGLSDPNINNPIASVNHSITYNVLVTSDNGCSTSDSVKLIVKPFPVFKVEPASQTICKNDVVTITASGGEVYNWLNIDSGNAYAPTAVVKPATDMRYSVRIYDPVCNYSDTLNASIIVKPLPNVSITKSNDIDCSFTSATLKASGGERYVWNSNSYAQVTNENLSNLVVSPSTTTWYRVKATNGNSCSNYDSIKVTVNLNAGINQYDLPTAFTPNNDGKNDCFGIKSWGSVSQLDFSIFNRWGERVFYTKNPSDCWNGTYKNYQQQTGAFVYFIKARTLCGGEFNRKGIVTLIR